MPTPPISPSSIPGYAGRSVETNTFGVPTGRERPPLGDAEAKRLNLRKVVDVGTGQVYYLAAPDAREYVQHGKGQFAFATWDDGEKSSA